MSDFPPCPECLDPGCAYHWNTICQYDLVNLSCGGKLAPEFVVKEAKQRSRDRFGNPPPMNPAPGEHRSPRDPRSD